MKLNQALILLIMTLLTGSLFGQVKSIEVEGRGANKNAAIQDALVLALKATKGVHIEANSVSESEYEKVMTDIATTCKAEKSLSENIKTATQGYITSFDILGDYKDSETNEVVVRVRAFVFEYDPTNPNPGSRPRVVVMPFDFRSATVKGPVRADGSPELNKSVLANEMSTMLISKLAEAGYFTIIEGSKISQSLKDELKYSEAAGVDPKMQAKMNRLLSADWVVSSTITEFIALPTKAGVSKSSASFRGSMKIVNAATGEQVGSGLTFRMSKSGIELHEALTADKSLDSNSSLLCMAESTDYFSAQVKSLLGPAKVCSVSKKRGRGAREGSWMFSLDNSAGIIEPNQIYDVFIQEIVKRGDCFVPEMSEDLLSIKIDRADGNFAYGKIQLIGDEALEDFIDTLVEFGGIIEAADPTTSLIAKRR